MRKRRVLLLAVLVLACVGTGLEAQQSNTNVATSTVYKNNTDYFMSVVDFTAIGKSFCFLGLTSGQLEVGASGVIMPGFYLGGYYIGSGAAVSSPTDWTTQVTSQYLLDNNTIIGKTVTTNVFGRINDSMSNTAFAMLGFSGIGVRLGVVQSETMTWDKWGVNSIAPNVTSTTWTSLSGTPGSGQQDSTAVTYAADLTTVVARSSTTYPDGLSVTGTLQPVLNVGARLPLGKLVLKPQVTAKLDLHQDNMHQSYVNYVQSIGSGFPTYPATNGITEVQTYTSTDWTRAQGYMGLDVIADAALDIPGSKGGLSTFEIYYDFNTRLYNNSYTDNAGATQSVPGTASTIHTVSYTYMPAGPASGVGVADLKAAEIATNSQSTHTITPSYRCIMPFSDQLSLGSLLTAQVDIFNSAVATTGALSQLTTFTSSIDPLDNITDTVNKTFTGSSVATSTLTVTPTLNAALQFAAIPKVLVFSLGGRIALPKFVNYARVTTFPGINTFSHVQTDGQGDQLINEYSSTLGDPRTETQLSYGDLNGISTGVAGGVSLTMAEGVVLDMRMVNFFSGADVGTSFTFQLSISK